MYANPSISNGLSRRTNRITYIIIMSCPASILAYSFSTYFLHQPSYTTIYFVNWCNKLASELNCRKNKKSLLLADARVNKLPLHTETI